MNKVEKSINLGELEFVTWGLIHQTRDVLARVRNKELNNYGITQEQSAILVMIKRLNSLKIKPTPGIVSKAVLREPHSVSSILTRMEKEGFINKISGMGKNRSEKHILLTEKGEQAYKCSLKREMIKEIMSCLPQEECLRLNASLLKLRDKGLQELGKGKPTIDPQGSII
jgi:MarR family transcriptional regulator, organic hydroperoxide resistance regulator